MLLKCCCFLSQVLELQFSGLFVSAMPINIPMGAMGRGGTFTGIITTFFPQNDGPFVSAMPTNIPVEAMGKGGTFTGIITTFLFFSFFIRWAFCFCHAYKHNHGSNGEGWDFHWYYPLFFFQNDGPFVSAMPINIHMMVTGRGVAITGITTTIFSQDCGLFVLQCLYIMYS